MGKKNSLLTMIIVAIVAAAVGSGATILIMKGISKAKDNIAGSWYSAYAGRTFSISLNDDKTFEFGYEGQEKTTGNYSNENGLLTLSTDEGSNKLFYEKFGSYIEINGEKYYATKELAEENDAYFYVPDDYDTSMFTKMTASELIEKFNDGEAAFVLTARGSCGYCQQFRPVAAESLKKYNYTLYYLDTTTLTDEDYENIPALDDKFSILGSTPNVFYFKNKKVVAVQEGAADAETYGKFLEDNGVKAK